MRSTTRIGQTIRRVVSSLVAMCFILLFSHQSFAQFEWQKLSSPTYAQVKELFKNPPSYYSNSVTWGWNGPMSKEVIARDLDSLHALGFKCVTIEAGYKMPVEYLSDGWFKLVKTAVEEAKARDMHIWIIDEGKYPSGFAGGKFSRERPDLRMQGLVVYQRIPVSGGQAISLKIDKPIVSAVAVNLVDSTNTIINVISGQLNWKAPEGKWQILLVEPQFKTAVTRAVNNPTGGKDTTNALCDYLNPVAVRQFIDFTHEQYKKYVGNEFGKTILGFRGDEPDFAYTPWTPDMLQQFKQRKGYDVQPYLASFFLKNLTTQQKKAKADYWDVWSDLFGKNFFQQQADWCAQNHVEYMVHLNHDDAMIALVKSEGDYFKDFRSVQIPGIDVIWHQIWPGIEADFPKFASSAAHLFGRPRALSESFAAMNPAPNVEQAKWILNEQLVRGINLFEFMYFMSTSQGGGAKGYMVEKSFPSLMAYANRASYLLAQGKPAAQIAIYFPTTSLWLGQNESEKSTFDIARQLMQSQHDFDFMDEYSLTSASLNKATLINKSGQVYRAVVIPSVNTISLDAYKKLKAFAANGGTVIFAGELPSIIPSNSFLNATATLNFNWAQHAADEKFKATLSNLPTDVKLSAPEPEVNYMHRQWKDAQLYFFFNEGDQPVNTQAILLNTGSVEEWNADTGDFKNIPAQRLGDGMQLSLDMKPYETKFIIIKQ